MNRPKYIVVHTAAHSHKGKVYDTSAMEIDNWHKQNGWKGIGYHYVIRFDGRVEKGREEHQTGAHVRGLNSDSIGICMSGDGDLQKWTDEQFKSLKDLLEEILSRYPNIKISNIIGHREADNIQGVPEINKTCPGKLIDMKQLRASMGARELLRRVAYPRNKEGN